MQKDCEHILPANIDDEAHPRLQRPYVREVLLRPNAKINTARPGELLERRNDILNARFIGNPVIAGVESLMLRELGDHAPEFLIVDLLRQAGGLSQLNGRNASNKDANDEDQYAHVEG